MKTSGMNPVSYYLNPKTSSSSTRYSTAKAIYGSLSGSLLAMSSKQKIAITRPMRRTRSRLSPRRRFCRAQKSSITVVNGGSGGTCSSVSDKLKALKNLIPSHNGDIKADELFQETADYIVLLKAQVLLLQSLIDFYGSTQNHNAV